MPTKKSFISSVNLFLKDVPKEKQVQKIEQMISWLKELIEKKKENRTYCRSCQNYILTKSFKEVSQREVRHETIYTDCGYGDDDTHGDVEYMVIYRVCPVCGQKEQIKKLYIRTISEFNREGKRIH